MSTPQGLIMDKLEEYTVQINLNTTIQVKVENLKKNKSKQDKNEVESHKFTQKKKKSKKFLIGKQLTNDNELITVLKQS